MENKDSNLLELLEMERGKFTTSDESVMESLIDELVNRGVYPSKTISGISILEMVKSWGVYWYKYDEPLECPYCGVDLRDLKNGPPFKREIAMSDFFLDRVVDYVCPDCYRSLNDGKHYDKNEFEKANNEPLTSN